MVDMFVGLLVGLCLLKLKWTTSRLELELTNTCLPRAILALAH